MIKNTIRTLNKHNIVNAITAFLFTTTGPLAIMLSVGTQGGLTDSDISSWIFAGYALGGLISIVFSYVYRMPITFAWTIPGGMLLLYSLDHLHFREIIGAYILSGILISVLGMTGWIKILMDKLPFPIVMGMIGGLFLPYGLKIITAFQEAFWISLAVLGAYIFLSLSPRLATVIPPVFGALVSGFAVTWIMGDFHVQHPPVSLVVHPNLYSPAFSWQAMLELVIPLTITVIGIQNAQGFAVLKMNGYEPPINKSTFICGVGTVIYGIFGSVPACVTGPVNAILNHSGDKETRYVGGILYGVGSIVFGMLSPIVVSFTTAMPTAFIGMLGGLALIQVLRNSLVEAFASQLSLGALTTFLVTVSNVAIFHIGSAFWGLVFGIGISRLFERDGLKAKSDIKKSPQIDSNLNS